MISLTDEFILRLEVLSWLTEDNLVEISTQQERFSSILDPGLVKCLIDHLSLLRDFNNFNPETDGQVIDTEEKSENISEEAYEIAELLEKNTIEVTRWLSHDKESFKFLSQVVNTASSGVPTFLDVAKDLRKLYLIKLITPVEEELSREQELEEIDAKLKKAKAEEAENNIRLVNLKRQREEGKESKNKEIQKLRIELEKNERETTESIKDTQKKNEQRYLKLKKENDSKTNEYEIKREKLRETLNNLRIENKKNEEEMIKNKQKLQSNKIEVTIKEYDKEMIENTQQLDRETKAFTENKHSLEATENLIREIRMEKSRRDEEEKKDSAKRANFEQMQKQKDLASAYIAAHWKGLKTRQDYEKLKKSKKKRRGKK
jgi:hypothetical protein